MALTGGSGIRTMETKMKKFTKIALGALMLAGVTTVGTAAISTPAEARVSVGIGLGFPGYYGGYGGYYGPAYYGPAYYDPYYYRPYPYYYGRPYYRGGYYGGRGYYRGGYGHHGYGRHWR
jgi:hypothetical protein